MVLELNDSHEKANVGKRGLKERVLIPFLTGSIAMAMFSGCSNDVDLVTEEYDDYSNYQTSDESIMPEGEYLKIDDRTFVLRDGVEDPKYSVEEYAGSTHVIADSDEDIVVSGYIGREIARFKGDVYVRNNALTTRDFNYITDIEVNASEDLSWLKYCNNLEFISIREKKFDEVETLGDEDVSIFRSSKDDLASAPNLRNMYLSVPTFTSSEYGVVSGMDGLKDLELSCDYIEPGFIEGLTQLDYLRIDGSRCVNLDCSKLDFLSNLEFSSPYCAAINMSIDEYNKLVEAGVDIAIRDSRFFELEQEDMDSYFELAASLDGCVQALELSEDTPSAEVAGIIVSTALAGAEKEEDEMSAQSTYYFMAAGLANRLGIELSQEQLNLEEMCEYINKMAVMLEETATEDPNIYDDSNSLPEETSTEDPNTYDDMVSGFVKTR